MFTRTPYLHRRRRARTPGPVSGSVKPVQGLLRASLPYALHPDTKRGRRRLPPPCRRVSRQDNTSIASLPAPPIEGGEPLDAYHIRVGDALEDFMEKEVEVPPPDGAETLKGYTARLLKFADRSSVWQGLFDVEWRRRVANNGKNDLVMKWSQLGFVIFLKEPKPLYVK